MKIALSVLALLVESTYAGWIPANLTVCQFNDKGDTVSIAYQVNGRPQESTKFDYSPTGILQSVLRLDSFHEETNSWDTNSVIRYAYDSQGRRSSSTFWLFEWNQTMTAGKLVERERSVFHFTGSVLDSFTDYTSYANGKFTKTGQARYSYLASGEVGQKVYYDTAGPGWKPNIRIQWTYGADGLSGILLRSYYESGNWIPYLRTNWTWDGNKRPIEEIEQDLDGSQWKNTMRYTTSYSGRTAIINGDQWDPTTHIRSGKQSISNRPVDWISQKRFNIKGQMLPDFPNRTR